MNKKLLALAGVLVLGASLQASTAYNYDFTTTDTQYALGASTAFSPSTGSVTATVSAFTEATGSYGSSANLSTAYLGTYGTAYGMGVCSQSQGSGCSSPQHQVDNSQDFDFILIQFSSAVNLSSITLGNFGGNDIMDMTYWTNVATTVVGGHTETAGPASGSGTTIDCGGTSQMVCNNNTGLNGPADADANGIVTYDNSNPGTNAFTGTDVTSLLIAAQFASGLSSSADSYFKVQDLSVSTFTSATPEPASFFLIGSGLLAGAVFGRRRMSKKSDS